MIDRSCCLSIREGLSGSRHAEIGWAFFLSEHTTRSVQKKIDVDLSTDLNPVEKVVATFPALRWTTKRLFYGQGEKS